MCSPNILNGVIFEKISYRLNNKSETNFTQTFLKQMLCFDIAQLCVRPYDVCALKVTACMA